MAYGPKFRVEGASPDGHDYRADIEQDGYSGSVTTFTPAVGGIGLRWDLQTREDLTEPWMVSRGSIKVKEEDPSPLAEIFDGDLFEYRISIYQDGNLYFRGFADTNLYEDSLWEFLSDPRIAFTDGLGVLSDIAFEEAGSEENVSEALMRALSLLPTDLQAEINMEWYPDGVSVHPVELLYVPDEAWSEGGCGSPNPNPERKSGRAALRGLLRRFGMRMMQSGGLWRMRQRLSLLDDSLEVGTYDTSGSRVSEGTKTGRERDLTAYNATEESRSFQSEFTASTAKYRFKCPLKQVLPNPSFEDALTEWSVTGDAQRVEIDTVSNRQKTTTDQYAVKMTTGDASVQMSEAFRVPADASLEMILRWADIRDQSRGKVAVHANGSGHGLHTDLVTIDTPSLPGDDATLHLTQSVGDMSGSVEGTPMMPAGAKLRIFTDDPSVSPEGNEITLTEPLRVGDETVTGNLQQEIKSTGDQDLKPEIRYWSWTGQSAEETKIFDEDYFTNHEVRVFMVSQQGDPVHGPLKIRWGVKDAYDYGYYAVDDVGLEFRRDGETVKSFSTTTVDESENGGEREEIEVPIGIGPTDSSGSRIYTASRNQPGGWGRGSSGDQTLGELQTEESLRMQRSSPETRRFRLRLRSDDKDVLPHHVYLDGSTRYEAVAMRRGLLTGKASVELAELQDDGTSGLSASIAYSEEDEPASGSSGSSSVQILPTGDGAESWQDLTGIPDNLFARDGDADSYAKTTPLREGDITGALGYIPATETPGTGLASESDHKLGLADGGVGTLQLAADAVTPSKVKDGETLPVDISGDAETVDGYESAELGVLAEDETITGTWTHEADLLVDGAKMEADTFGTAAFGFSEKGGDLVLTDSNGIELIRQPKGGATQFVQGAEIGVIDAPADSLTQLINASVTSSTAAGEAVGYTFAVDNRSIVEISAEADGSGGIQNGSVAVTRELSVDGDISATGVGHFDITGDADSVDGLHKADLLPSGGQNITVGTFPNPTISVSPQGSGSGLNADQIDGYESAELAVLAEDETVTGTYTFASEIQAELGLTSGDDLMPSAGYAHSLGSSSQKWLTLDVAELRASTLVSQKELATVGGRQLVGTASELTEAARASDTSVTVRHNNLRSGDYLRLESGGDVEFMKVTSSATSVSAGYEYSVERDLDSTGANRWEKGDALFATSAGEGFIDLYAQHAFTDAEQSTISGPTIAFREQQPGYEAVPTRAAMGNLHDTYDYSTDTFGLAAGDKGGTWIAADAEHGFRVMSEQVKKIGLDPSGDAYFEGEVQAESGQVGGWSIRRTRIRKDTPSGTVVEGGRLSSGGNIKLDQEGDAVLVDGEGVLTGFGADAENVRAHVGTRGSDAELLVYRDADNYVSIGDGLGRSSMGISVQAGGTSILETRETNDFSSGGNSYPARIDGLLVKNGAAIEGAAVIDGTITATEADLTNIFSQTLTVNSGGEIKSGSTDANGDPLFRIQSNGDAYFGDKAAAEYVAFNDNGNGRLSVQGEITAERGTIGGWDVNGGSLQGGNLKLTPAGSIANTQSNTWALKESGDARFGDPAGEHLMWDGTLSIDASTFDLEAGGLSIQSSSSTIELGNPPTKGIVLDADTALGNEEIRMYSSEMPDDTDDHAVTMGPESDVDGAAIVAVNGKDTGVVKNGSLDSSTYGTYFTLHETDYGNRYFKDDDAVDPKNAVEMLAEVGLEYSFDYAIELKITYELEGSLAGTLEKKVVYEAYSDQNDSSSTATGSIAATLRDAENMGLDVILELSRELNSGEYIDYEIRRKTNSNDDPISLVWYEYRPRTVINKYGITTHMGPNVAKTLGSGAAGSVGTSGGGTSGVSSFEGRTGDIALQDGDVTGALGYVPVDEATTINPGTGLAGGGDLTQNRTLSVADLGVDTTQLAGSAVTTAKLAGSSVTTAKIADGGVTPAKVDETGRYTVEGLEVGADVTIGGFRLSDDGDLVLTDTNGIELIRQPKGGATQFVQGAEIGVIDAPEDSLTQIINAASTSSSASGDAVGYTFAVDNQSFLEVSAESNSGGGIRNGRVVAHREVDLGSNQIRFDDGLIKGDGSGALQVLAADGTASGELVVDTLTVTGSIDEKDTTTLNVQDQWITVADGQSGTPSVDAGLIVERGDQPNARLLWSEGTDEWGRKMKGGTFEPFWHDGNVSGGTDIVMSSTQVAHANTGASLSVTTGEGEVVSALSTDGRGHVGSASVKSLSLDEWGAASGDLDLGGYNIENLHRIGDPDWGNYLDFGSSNYVEVQDGTGSRGGLVARDLYVNQKNAWLTDDNLIDLNAGNGLAGGGTTGLKDQMTIRHGDTSTQGNAAVGGATIISEITLDDYGHLTGITAEDRSISDWAKAEADLDLNGKNVQDAGTVEAEEARAARHTTKNFEVRENPKSDSLDFVYTG